MVVETTAGVTISAIRLAPPPHKDDVSPFLLRRLSDELLGSRLASGEAAAFDELYRRYVHRLAAYGANLLGDAAAGDDVAQSALLKAYGALRDGRVPERVKPWLYRIAHNEAVELRRRERPAEELVESVDVAAAGTEERAEDKGRLRMLLADIADLPERQRASLVMREVNGLGFGEIGAALGTSPGAVRQALYEARRGLAEMDHGRDMQCDLAARMMSDADGRPRDRGVRAHLRDCTLCRRVQAEIRGRGRTLAAISPMPAIAAVGALKAALGSGAAAGGSGAAAAAAAAGGAGAGVAAGSVGAAALLKPAASLLTVLAIGTAAVDHGAIFEVGRHDPAGAGPAKSADVLAGPAERGRPRTSHAVARHTERRGAVAVTGVPADSPSGRDANEPVASVHAAQRRDGEDVQSHEDAATSDGEPPALEGAAHGEPLLPDVQAPALPPAEGGRPDVTSVGVEGSGAGDGDANQPQDPEGSAPVDETAPADPEASADVPPGQAEKESVPPGQAKIEVEAASEPSAGEPSAPATGEVEASARVSPGQVKKEVESLPEATGLVDAEEATSE